MTVEMYGRTFKSVRSANRWRRGADQLIAKLTKCELEEARKLVEESYQSVSSRFRIVARLPNLMNELEALQWAIRTYYEDEFYCNRVEQLLEQSLTDKNPGTTYRRTYSGYWFAREYKKTLTIREYKAFRLVGGESASY